MGGLVAVALLGVAGALVAADVDPVSPPAEGPGATPASQPAPDPAVEADGGTVIVVEGRRRTLVTDPANPSRFVTTVDLSRATETVTSVADELAKTVGVTVRRLGGLGSFSTVSIRGSTAQQVELFWDGIPLNRADAGLTNLEEIPVDLIERMEIYRGVAPAQFGAAGIGGVINLVPRQAAPVGSGTDGAAARGPAHGMLSVSGGSFDTYKYDVMASGRADDGTDWMAFYHRLQSRGDFRYKNDNGTPLNPNDDRDEKRVNNDFIAQDFFLRAGRALPGDWRCTVLADGYDKRQGLPGLNAVQARKVRLRIGRGIGGVKFEAPRGAGGGERLSTALGFNALYEEVDFHDPLGELSLSPARDLAVTHSLAATAQTGFVVWPDGLLVALFGEARHEETQAIYRLPTLSHGPIERRERGTAVVQGELRLFTGRVKLIPTARGELVVNRLAGDPKVLAAGQQGANDATLPLLSPSIGAVYTAGPALEFRVNAGRFHRVPTLFELFGNRGGVVGSPDLAPERADVFDGGLQAQPPLPAGWGRLEVEVAVFYSYTRDLIALVRNSQNTSRAANIGAAQNLGEEFTLHWDSDSAAAWATAAVQFNYTHQDPRDVSNAPFLNGNYLPNQPVDAWFLRVELTHHLQPWMNETQRGRWAAASHEPAQLRTSWWAECAYSGETFHDRANLYLVEARTVLNAGSTLTFAAADGGARMTFSLEILNLLDNRVTDEARYPLPGRSWYVTWQGQF